MKTIISFIFLCLISLAACGLLGDDEPDLPGKIVFSADDESGTSQIFTMNANGTGLKQLTFWDNSSVDPAWSPDGSRIAFATYYRATTLGPSLYIMDADGSNKRPLKKLSYEAPNALYGSEPAWSPDGKRIAYQFCTNCEAFGSNYEIAIVDVEGEAYDSTQIYIITSYLGSDKYPSWSPDGERIVFFSGRGYYNADTMRYKKDLYIVNVDGTNLQRLTNTGHAARPVWGATSEKIAFEWRIHGNDIFIYHTETGKITEVKSGLQFAGNPLWNRQGKQLMVFGRETENSTTEIRLLEVKNSTTEIIRTVKLKDQAIGRDYDWHINEESGFIFNEC